MAEFPTASPVVIEDASNGNAIVGGGTLSGGRATVVVPAGVLLAGTHNLIAVYAGDSSLASSQSSALVQTVQVVTTSVVINGNISSLAGVQRSMVDSIVYTFSEAVNLAATNAFSIALDANYSKGTLPTLNWTALNPNADGSSTQWVVTFSGAGVLNGSIGDGVYDITLNGSAVTSDANPTVAAQGRTDIFHRLFGDAQGTGIVNGADYNAFLSTFNASSTQNGYLAYFNEDGNRRIDAGDYNAFLANNGAKFKNVTAIETI